jgi:hypothetical protein
MEESQKVTDTWARPIGSLEAPTLLSAIPASQIALRSRRMEGQRPGDLFRTADDQSSPEVTLESNFSKKVIPPSW